MAVRLKGAGDLRKRLNATAESLRGYGRTWAKGTRDDARRLTRPHRRTGRLDRSFRFRTSNARAAVYARYTAVFLNAGSKPHAIHARRARALVFNAGGRTIFTKRVNHRGHHGTHFARKAAMDALHDNPMRDAVIDAWNRAA